jgi:hypothetical protein
MLAFVCCIFVSVVEIFACVHAGVDTNSQRRMDFDYLLINRFSAKVKRACDK